MLTNMSLAKYKSEFLKQGIDGKRLLEIDENSLEEAFQVRSKFHRKKLMRVVSGAIHSGTFISKDS